MIELASLKMLRHAFLIMAIFCSVLPAFCQEASVDFEPAPDRPFFISGKMMLDAEEYSTLSIRIQSSQSGTARLFWSISYNPELDGSGFSINHIKRKIEPTKELKATIYQKIIEYLFLLFKIYLWLKASVSSI